MTPELDASARDVLADVAVECMLLGMRKDETIVAFVRRIAPQAQVAQKISRWGRENPQAVSGDAAGESLLDLVRDAITAGERDGS